MPVGVLLPCGLIHSSQLSRLKLTLQLQQHRNTSDALATCPAVSPGLSSKCPQAQPRKRRSTTASSKIRMKPLTSPARSREGAPQQAQEPDGSTAPTTVNPAPHIPLKAAVISNPLSSMLGTKNDCHGLTPAGNSAPHSFSLTPQKWDGRRNQQREKTHRLT